MFRLLCSPHSFHLIELLTTSLILISFFFSFSRIVTEKPYQGSVNKLLYCIVQNCKQKDGADREFLRYIPTCYQGLKSNFIHRLLYGSKSQNFPLNLSVPSHKYATEVYYHKLL